VPFFVVTVNCPAVRPPFRGVVGNQQAHFTDGIDRGGDVTGVEVAGVLAGRAVHVENDLALLAAVDARNAAAVPAAVIVGLRQRLRTGQRHNQADRIAAASRSIDDLRQVDVHGAVGAVGSDVHRIGLDLDRAGHIADFQVNLVQVDAFLRLHDDAFLVVCLEAGLRDMQAV
jgi:hypothetical protein